MGSGTKVGTSESGHGFVWANATITYHQLASFWPLPSQLAGSASEINQIYA